MCEEQNVLSRRVDIVLEQRVMYLSLIKKYVNYATRR